MTDIHNEIIRSIAEVRDLCPVSAAATKAGVKLKRTFEGWVGCCPFHEDKTPSFTVFANDTRFQCFGGGCEARGDVIDFVRRIHHVGLREAISILNGRAVVGSSPPQGIQRPKSNTQAAAIRIIEASSPIEGTPGEEYFRRRGIAIQLEGCLRFSMLPPPKESGILTANGPAPLPAVIAIVSDRDGNAAGIQRIYLTPEGRKAASADGKVKFSLGSVAGGAIRLGAIDDSSATIAGSVEDGLSLIQLGAPSVWVAPGEAMLHRMWLPTTAASVVIGSDADEAGKRASAKAAAIFMDAGKEVRVIYPAAPFKDFNEELQEMAA